MMIIIASVMYKFVLQWLKDGFLKYLQDWEDSVNKRKRFTAAQKAQMLLSSQTRERIEDDRYVHFAQYTYGTVIVMTFLLVRSFVELTQDLLSVPGVEYVLSERLCQDPLESFFGKQRAAGGRNENSSSVTTVTLRVQRSAALEPLRGNCRKRPVDLNALMTHPCPNVPGKQRNSYCKCDGKGLLII